MTKKLRVGAEIKGFYSGYFGRDSYGYKEVVATGKFKGERWALFYASEYGGSDGHLVALKGSDLKAVEREAEAQIEGLWEGE